MPVSRSPARPPSGSPAYSPTDLPVYRGGGSSFSPLSLSPLAWARTPGVSSGASCSIALDGSAFASLGYSPADVSGQTASVTGAASGFYGAGTLPRPMPTSGIVWVASKDMAYSGTGVDRVSSLVIVGYDSSGDAIGPLYFASNGTDQGAGVGTSPFLALSGLTGGTIGVGHDGEVYAYDRGTDSIIKASDVDPVFAGAFAGAVTLRAGVFIESSSTVTASVTVVTSSADMVDIAGIAGTGEDWCGNPLQVVPYLYQDSAGLTPVTGAGQDVGAVDDQGSLGGLWSQVTATARPTYEIGPARRVYDPDDALPRTLPAISGGQIVIISPAGTWIDDFNFAGGTFTFGPDTYTGGPVGLMSLLGNAEIEIIILPTPMTEAEQAKMVSYAQGLGSAGLITLGPEVIPDPSFDNAGAWTTTAGVAVTGGAAVWTSAANISNVSVANVTTLGRTHEITVVVDSVSGGALRVAPSRTGATPSSDMATAGTYTFMIMADGSINSVIIFSVGASTTASVSSVSVREVIMP